MAAESRDVSLNREYFAYGLLYVAPAMFASNNVAARLADGLVPPMTLAFWRWGLTSLLLLPFAGPALWRCRAVLRTEWRQLLALGISGMAVASVATYVAATMTTATSIGMIYAGTPAAILLLDWMLTRRRLSPMQIFGMVICFGGTLFIMVRGDLALLRTLSLSSGDLWAAAGALGWATYSVLLKHWPSRLPMRERALSTALVGACLLLPLALGEVVAVQPMVPGMKSATIILTVAVIAGVGALVSHAHVTAVLGTRRTVVLLYLIPIYNVLLAWLIIGENLQLFQAIGGGAILCGVYLSATTRSG